MGGARDAATARQHDGFVVAPDLAPDRVPLFEGAEIAPQGRAPEFVVVGGRAYGALEHDVQGGSQLPGPSGFPFLFPGLGQGRDAQIGHGETRDARLRLRANAGGGFVSQLAAGAGGGAGKGRDGGGVVVGLDLQHDARFFRGVAVAAVGGAGEEACGAAPPQDRGVVGVGGQRAAGGRARRGAGGLDHVKQAVRLVRAVYAPAGVENLVAAMLRIRLGEHHQLHIRGVPARLLKGLVQIGDFRF